MANWLKVLLLNKIITQSLKTLMKQQLYKTWMLKLVVPFKWAKVSSTKQTTSVLVQQAYYKRGHFHSQVLYKLMMSIERDSKQVIIKPSP